MTHKLEPSEFANWLDRYKSAWEQRDADQGAALFTRDATYHEMPFDPPFEGRDAIRAYWARVVQGQRDVSFTAEILACTGNEGLCRWRAAFDTDPGGDRIEFDGIFRCHFADATQVEAFQEWWHMKLTPANAGEVS